MPIEVEVPGQGVVEFPDGTPQGVMEGALRDRFGGPKSDAAEKLDNFYQRWKLPPSPRGAAAKALAEGISKPIGQKLKETEQAAFRPIIKLPEVKSDKYPYSAAILDQILRIGETIESPGGLMAGGAAKVGLTAAKVVAGGFGARVAAEVPSAAQAAGEQSVIGTPGEKARANVGLATTIVLPGLSVPVLLKAPTVPPMLGPEVPEHLQPTPGWTPEQARADLVARNLASPGTVRPQEQTAFAAPSPEAPPMEVSPPADVGMGKGAPPWQRPTPQVFGPVRIEEPGAVPPVESGTPPPVPGIPREGEGFRTAEDLLASEQARTLETATEIAQGPRRPIYNAQELLRTAPETARALQETVQETQKAAEGKSATTAPELPAGVIPAIQTPEGRVVTGEDHVSAYEKAKDTGTPDTSGSKEGFQKTDTGEFISREQAAVETGLPTATEPGKLHSSDLPQPGEENAIKTRQEPKGNQPEHPGTARGTEIPPERQEVRQEKGQPDSGSGRASEVKGVEPRPTTKNPKVGEVFARQGDYEFALTRGGLKERPEMYGVGMRRIGSKEPFESGGYGYRLKPEQVIRAWAEREVQRGEGGMEFTHPKAEFIWSDESDFFEKVQAEKAARQAEKKRIEAENQAIQSAYDKEWMAVDIGRGKQQTVKIRGAGGAIEKPMTVYGSLGITKNENKNTPYKYFITHVPSGFSLGNDLKIETLGQAKDFIKALIHTGVDLSKKEFSNDELSRLFQVKKAMFGDEGEVPEWWKQKAVQQTPQRPMPEAPPDQPKGIISGTKAEAWADQKIKGKLGGTSAMPFLDPEFHAAVVIKGAAIFERGIRDFEKWAEEMVKTYGPVVEMRLRDLYESSIKYYESGKANEPSKAVATLPADQKPLGQISPSTERFLIEKPYFTDATSSAGPWRPYLDALQNKSFPRFTTADRFLGEAATRTITARDYGRLRGLLFVHDALEGTDVDPRTFWIAIHEDNMRDIGRRNAENAQFFVEQGQAADAMKFAKLADEAFTWIGKEGSPFKSEQEYQDYLSQPEVQEAIGKWKQVWAEQKEPLFREANDIITDADAPGRGLQTGARVNAMFRYANEVEPAAGASGQQLKQLGTLRKKDPLAKRAKGTGTTYIDNPHEAMARAFEKEMAVVAQHQFLRRLIETGNAVVSEKRFEPDLTIAGEKTKAFQHNNFRFAKDKWIHVRESLVDEYMRVSGLKPDVIIPVFKPFANLFTRASIVGLSEGTTHASNLMMSILTSSGPTASPVLNSLLKAGFRADVIPTVAKTLIYGHSDTMPQVVFDLMQKIGWMPKEIAGVDIRGMTGKEYADRIMAALTRVGATKQAYRGFISSRLLNPIDRGVRVMMAEQFLKMADSGLVEKTETNLREYVNQSGNYWSQAQNQFLRLVKTTGVQPFATALWNFTQLGIKKGVLMSPGVKATTWQAAMKLRAEQVAGLVGVATLTYGLNWLLHQGHKDTPPDVPTGSVWGDRDDGSHWYIQLTRLFGYERGWRATGIQAFADAKRKGLDDKQATQAAVESISNVPLSLFGGPAVRFLTEAASGKAMSSPAFQRANVAAPTDEWWRQPVNNVAVAFQDANSIIGSAVDIIEGKPMIEALRRQLPRYLPRSGMSPEMVEKLPMIVERKEFQSYLTDTIRRARQLKPEAREEFVEQQAEKLNDWKEVKRFKAIARKAIR